MKVPLRGDFDSRALYVCRRSFPAPLGIVPWRRGMHLRVPKSGVGISVAQQAALQKTCHSEPVLKLVWESPSSSRLHYV